MKKNSYTLRKALALVICAMFVLALSVSMMPTTAQASSDGNTTLGDREIGSIVRLRENDVLVNYIVVHQGSPSADYQGFENSTILLRERVLPLRRMNSINVNDYQNSDMNVWLNGDFFNTLDAEIRNQIRMVHIPFRPFSGSHFTVNDGANGLHTRVFLLSHTEVAARCYRRQRHSTNP